MVFIDFNSQENKELLIEACERGHKDVVNVLIECGADVNFQVKRGGVDLTGDGCITPLIAACLKGHVEVVKILIDNKADEANNGRKTALKVLSKFRSENKADTIKVLLEAGANFNREIKEEIIKLAVNEGRADLIRLLKTKKQDGY